MLGELTHIERPLTLGPLPLDGPLAGLLPQGSTAGSTVATCSTTPDTGNTVAALGSTVPAACSTSGTGSTVAGAGSTATPRAGAIPPASPPRRYRTPSPYRTQHTQHQGSPDSTSCAKAGVWEGAGDSVTTVVVGRKVRVGAEVAVVHGRLSPRVSAMGGSSSCVSPAAKLPGGISGTPLAFTSPGGSAAGTVAVGGCAGSLARAAGAAGMVRSPPAGGVASLQGPPLHTPVSVSMSSPLKIAVAGAGEITASVGP